MPVYNLFSHKIIIFYFIGPDVNGVLIVLNSYNLFTGLTIFPTGDVSHPIASPSDGQKMHPG